MKAPISLCLICRNDEATLESCLKSLVPYVSETIVVDTGSTDNSPEIAKKYASKFEVFTDCNNLETGLIEDFSKARQYSFNLATQPWIIWADADDIVVGGEKLLNLISVYELNKGDIRGAAFLFPYEYSYDENGKVTCRHYRERLLTNNNKFHWVNPVHEVLVPIDNFGIVLNTVDDVIYQHRRQYFHKSVESGRNLRILRKYISGPGKDDARQLYYLGLECLNNNLIEESIKHLTKYVEVSGWEDERCMATLKLVDIYHAKSEYNTALNWSFKTIEIKENWGEGYFAAAKTFYYLAMRGGPNEYRNWERCAYFANIGLSLPPTKTVLFINPIERDVGIHRYLNMALNKLGKIKEALISVETALKTRPDDAPLNSNRKLYQIFLAKNQAIEHINTLLNIGDITKESYSNIIKLLNHEIIESAVYQKLSHTSYKTTNDKLDIVFYAGQGIEDWNPETVKITGIGGSELMMIEISKRLARLGHNVTVYNSCGTEDTYDGVKYVSHTKYQNIDCDISIVSRRADMLHSGYNINAQLTLLWVHDIFALNASNQLLLNADRIMSLSDWHRNYLIDHHKIHPKHVLKTRNGIDLNRFEKTVTRDPYRCVNSSSPDRSWPILLECWPGIKKQVPQASLHLYYGFKNWMVAATQDQGQLALIKKLQDKILDMKDAGVYYHDRVDQNKLAEEFLSSGVWLYPTWFSETSCISAMEAQAAGLRIVSSSIAALNETVSNRGTLIDGDWSTEEYKNKFVENTVSSLLDPNDSDRISLQQYARDNFSLDSLVTEWNQIFYRLLEEKSNSPIVPYMPLIKG